MFEIIFLWSLAFVWILFATIQDLRKREIANWLNFSLVIFAIAFRFFYSFLEAGDFSFFYQGLIGFAIFFALGNIFYYGKMFAGGDSKLMYALGPILPIYGALLLNLRSFLYFIILFLIIGALYGIIVSIVFGILNRKKVVKEFKVQFKKNKILFYILSLLAILLLGLGFLDKFFFYLALFVFVINYLILYAKSIDESCMVRKLKVSKLTEGDWLYEDLKVNGKVIKATWNGLESKDIALIRKYKKEILIRYGIQFGPVFLISFIIMVILKFCGILF
mgnify:CR=1 FL=1